MLSNKVRVLNYKSIFYRLKFLKLKASFTTQATINTGRTVNQCIIKCKNKSLNYYFGTTSNTFSEENLTSQNWELNESIGDYFTVLPNPQGLKTTPSVLLNDASLSENIKQCLREQNINKLTHQQNESLEVIRRSYDSILATETGSGKTLGYLLPIVQELIKSKCEEQNSPRALILVPSRELAYQVALVAETLGNCVGLKTKVVVGGNTKKIMFESEFSHVDLLIGTPGVINKLYGNNLYRLKNVAFTVLDEADSLLDNSFNNEIATISRAVPKTSQLTLVCATFPKNLPLSFSYDRQFTHVTSPLLHKPLSNITQFFSRVRQSAKPHLLLQLAQAAKNPIIVFASRNETCNWIVRHLKNNKLECSTIHGKMDHWTRVEQWNSFVNGPTNILVCPNSACKGIDLSNVDHVIHYDFPLYAADYIHGIGKVGRLSSSSKSRVTNLITNSEEACLVKTIEKAIRTDDVIQNVDGNISEILNKKIERRLRGDKL